MFKNVFVITLFLSSIAHAQTGYNLGNLYRSQEPPNYFSLSNYTAKQSYQKNNSFFKRFIKKNTGFYADVHAAMRLWLPFAISSTPWYQLTFKYVKKKSERSVTIDDTWGFLGPKIGYQGANNWGGELTAFLLLLPTKNEGAPTVIPGIITLAGKKVGAYNLYHFKINTYVKIGVSFPVAWISHSQVDSPFSSTTNGFINIGALYQLQSKLSLEGSMNLLIPLSDPSPINKRNSSPNGLSPRLPKTNNIGWVQLGLTYHFI